MVEVRKTGQPLAFTEGDVQSFVREISKKLGLSLDFGGRFGTGDGSGAYKLNAEGRSLVLKIQKGGAEGFKRASDATKFLRQRGYPAPEFVAVGDIEEVGYALQTMLPGEPLAVCDLGVPQVDQLLQMNELQADGLELAEVSWPQPATAPVLKGGNGYCLIETMLDHSPATSTLMGRLQDIVGATEPEAFPRRNDVVHFDLSPSNILLADGAVSGVIDWEGTQTGDRAFDLVTTAFYCPELRGRLLTRAIEVSGREAVRAYLAHLTHRNVEWSIRFYPHEVERRLLEANSLLAEFA